MFPSQDVARSHEHFVERESRRAIIGRRPDLTDSISSDDDLLALTLPHPTGGSVVIARVRHPRASAGTVAVPNGVEAELIVPTSIQGFADAVDAALPRA